MEARQPLVQRCPGALSRPPAGAGTRRFAQSPHTPQHPFWAGTAPGTASQCQGALKALLQISLLSIEQCRPQAQVPHLDGVGIPALHCPQVGLPGNAVSGHKLGVGTGQRLQHRGKRLVLPFDVLHPGVGKGPGVGVRAQGGLDPLLQHPAYCNHEPPMHHVKALPPTVPQFH